MKDQRKSKTGRGDLRLKLPPELPTRVDQVTVQQCPTCHESIGYHDRQYLEFSEAGKWERHRHQPKGAGPFFFDTRCCSSGPLTAKDFTL